MPLPLSRYLNVDPRRPRASAFCDRCGFRYNHYKLNWQFDYRGFQLQNLWILVCPRCDDRPQPQYQPVIIGPDPVPVKDPRPGWRGQQEGQAPVFSVQDLINGKMAPLTDSGTQATNEPQPVTAPTGEPLPLRDRKSVV